MKCNNEELKKEIPEKAPRTKTANDIGRIWAKEKTMAAGWGCRSYEPAICDFCYKVWQTEKLFAQALAKQKEELMKIIQDEYKSMEQELVDSREWIKRVREDMERTARMFGEKPDDGELWAASERSNIAFGAWESLDRIKKQLEKNDAALKDVLKELEK